MKNNLTIYPLTKTPVFRKASYNTSKLHQIDLASPPANRPLIKRERDREAAKLGSGASMIRVRDLELQPDPPKQRLNANIRLVASYQKNRAAAPPAKPSTAKAK